MAEHTQSLGSLFDPKDLLGGERGRGEDKEEKREGAEEEGRTTYIRENIVLHCLLRTS